MGEMKKILEKCQHEQKQFVFNSFSREDALAIGLKINEKAKKENIAAAIEITINNLVVFRYFSEETAPDSELWLARKRNAVDLMQTSTLCFMAWLETNGETMEGRKLEANKYAAGGGGFPIILKGTGCVGSICVSGASDHMDDHRLIIQTLTEWFAK